MKVKDLIKKLESVNPNMEVYCTSAAGDYDYSIVHTACAKSILIDDGDDFIGENPKEKTVFVIDEK